MNSYSKLIPALFILVACGGSAPAPQTPSPSSSNIPLSCTASLKQGTNTYSVQGNNLIIGTSTMPREAAGAAGRPVYGTWLLGDQSQSGLHVKATLQIDPSAVTVKAACSYVDGRSTTAVATSAATITDTEITIAQAKNATIPFGDDSEAGEGEGEGEGESGGATF